MEPNLNTKNEKSELEILIEKRENLNQRLDELIIGEYGYEEPERDSEEEYKNSMQYHIDEIADEIYELDTKIGKIYYEREMELYRGEYNEGIGNYTRGNVISDLMSIDDLFDRRERAKTLASYISDITTQTPFNIGVFARWGEGKTTFLNYLNEELESINKKERNKNKEIFKTYVINYDASEYEDKDKIWASIMRAMFLQYEATTWFPKLWYNISKIKCDRKKYGKSAISYILSLVIVCILSSYSINTLLNDWNNAWKTITASGASIIAIVVAITKVLLPTVRGLLESAVPLSEKLVNNIKLPNYVVKLGERENIKRDLSILINAWISKRRGKSERIVLIIDELDRCSEKGIIEFFQSMQLFLKVPQLIIIFAIDQEYLKKAISNSFKIADEKEINEFVVEYLDKYINIPISLDTHVNYSAYIDYLLNNVVKNEDSSAFSKEEIQVIKVIFETIQISFLTPRKVKKIINMLILSKETCFILNKEYEGTEIIKFKDYILWFLLTYFYKEAAEKILYSCERYSKYFKIKYVFNSMSTKENKELMEIIDNRQVINLIGKVTINDVYIYERIRRGFTKII